MGWGGAWESCIPVGLSAKGSGGIRIGLGTVSGDTDMYVLLFMFLFERNYGLCLMWRNFLGICAFRFQGVGFSLPGDHLRKEAQGARGEQAK